MQANNHTTTSIERGNVKVQYNLTKVRPLFTLSDSVNRGLTLVRLNFNNNFFSFILIIDFIFISHVCLKDIYVFPTVGIKIIKWIPLKMFRGSGTIFCYNVVCASLQNTQKTRSLIAHYKHILSNKGAITFGNYRNFLLKVQIIRGNSAA